MLKKIWLMCYWLPSPDDFWIKILPPLTRASRDSTCSDYPSQKQPLVLSSGLAMLGFKNVWIANQEIVSKILFYWNLNSSWKHLTWLFIKSSVGPKRPLAVGLQRVTGVADKSREPQGTGLHSCNPTDTWETRVLQNPRERLCRAQSPEGQRPTTAQTGQNIFLSY